MKEQVYYMNKKNGLVYHAFLNDSEWNSKYCYSTINGAREYTVFIEKSADVPKTWIEVQNNEVDYWWNSKSYRKTYIEAFDIEKMAKKHKDWYCDDVLEITEAIKGAYLAGELDVDQWDLWEVVKEGVA